MQQAAGPVAGERLRSAEVLRTKEEDERSSWWPTSGRTGKAPGARWPRPPGWMNYLRPDLKRGNYTNDEDELIICLHALLGNKYVLACLQALLCVCSGSFVCLAPGTQARAARATATEHA